MSEDKTDSYPVRVNTTFSKPPQNIKDLILAGLAVPDESKASKEETRDTGTSIHR